MAMSMKSEWLSSSVAPSRQAEAASGPPKSYATYTSASPSLHCKPLLHLNITSLNRHTQLVCSLLLDCVVLTIAHHSRYHHLHPSYAPPSSHHSMNRRLAIVVLFALCLQPTAAMSSDMDFSLSISPMQQFYTDLDGSLRCLECALSYWDCMCAVVCQILQGYNLTY